MEANSEENDMNSIVEAFEKAGEIALSICVDDEKQSSTKRSGLPLTHGTNSLSNLLEYCLLRPGHLLAEAG